MLAGANRLVDKDAKGAETWQYTKGRTQRRAFGSP
jgi:hypothetical protein